MTLAGKVDKGEDGVQIPKFLSSYTLPKTVPIPKSLERLSLTRALQHSNASQTISKADILKATDGDAFNYAVQPKASLPIIISIPHAGEMALQGVPQRSKGTTVLDDKTLVLGLALFDELRLLSSEEPSLVFLHVNRKWVDANRGAPFHALETAYDSQEGKIAYEQYHATIAREIAFHRSEGREPLLIDIHGNSFSKLAGLVEPAAFLPKFVEQLGIEDLRDALSHSGGLYEYLEDQGLKIYTGKPIFDGGYICRHYSGKEPSERADSLQFEFHFEYRSSAERAEQTGRALGRALWKFLTKGLGQGVYGL